MSSSEGALLNNGVKGSTGRSTKNKAALEISRIGEQNCVSLYNLHLNIAINAEEIGDRISAQQFLLNKILPNAKSKKITIDLKPMENIQDISDNENIVVSNICDGNISLDEGEKLFQMLEQRRSTRESMDVIEKLKVLQQRMEDAGLI
jgi:hypothetical protein